MRECSAAFEVLSPRHLEKATTLFNGEKAKEFRKKAKHYTVVIYSINSNIWTIHEYSALKEFKWVHSEGSYAEKITCDALCPFCSIACYV